MTAATGLHETVTSTVLNARLVSSPGRAWRMALSWKSIVAGTCAIVSLPPEALAAAPCVRPTRAPFAQAAYYAPAQGLTGNALKLALNDLIDGHTD